MKYVYLIYGVMVGGVFCYITMMKNLHDKVFFYEMICLNDDSQVLDKLKQYPEIKDFQRTEELVKSFAKSCTFEKIKKSI